MDLQAKINFQTKIDTWSGLAVVAENADSWAAVRLLSDVPLIALANSVLAVFAIEEVAHRLAAGFVRFSSGLAFVGGYAAPGCGVG